jgi:hypothetical protein
MKGYDPRPSEEHARQTKSKFETIYPSLVEVARRHGYALAVHGSLERDIDLVAVPWVPQPRQPQELAEAIYRACEAVFGWVSGPSGWTERENFSAPPGALPNPAKKPLGRLGWVIQLGGPYIDLSIFPPSQELKPSCQHQRNPLGECLHCGEQA